MPTRVVTYDKQNKLGKTCVREFISPDAFYNAYVTSPVYWTYCRITRNDLRNNKKDRQRHWHICESCIHNAIEKKFSLFVTQYVLGVDATDWHRVAGFLEESADLGRYFFIAKGASFGLKDGSLTSRLSKHSRYSACSGSLSSY